QQVRGCWRRRRAQDPHRQVADLRVQIHHGDGPAGGERFPVFAHRPDHEAAGSADTGGSADGGVSCGGVGLGPARYGKRRVAGWVPWSTPSLIRGPSTPPTMSVKNLSTMS